jgi:hypothetical protein
MLHRTTTRPSHAWPHFPGAMRSLPLLMLLLMLLILLSPMPFGEPATASDLSFGPSGAFLSVSNAFRRTGHCFRGCAHDFARDGYGLQCLSANRPLLQYAKRCADHVKHLSPMPFGEPATASPACASARRNETHRPSSCRRTGTLWTCANSPAAARRVNSSIAPCVRYCRPQMLTVLSQPLLRHRHAVQAVTPTFCNQFARLIIPPLALV